MLWALCTAVEVVRLVKAVEKFAEAVGKLVEVVWKLEEVGPVEAASRDLLCALVLPGLTMVFISVLLM